MVVFTCSYCGDSVKKNQVEKHYMFGSCRGRDPQLTCVDCLKDFAGDAFVAHTSCVTEEERYAAKGFISKAPSTKGKEKQETWVQFIKSIVDSDKNISPDIRHNLKWLSEDPGIPQKKNRFLNFCKNKCRERIGEMIWDYLESKKQEWNNKTSCQDSQEDIQIESKKCSQEDRKRKRVDSNNSAMDGAGNDFSDRSKHDMEHSKNSDFKKKKQKQEKKEKSCDSISSQHDEIHGEHTQVGSKKEKKKKKKFNDINDLNGDCVKSENEIVENIEEEAMQSTETPENGPRESVKHLSRKEMKEKRKKESYERQLLEIQNEPVHNVDDEEQVIDSELPGAKKKKKHRQVKDDNNSEKELPIKIKSKKEKYSDTHIHIENGESKEIINDDLEAAVKPAKFDWEETVIKVLESKGELPLKRVEKKVVNEYMNTGLYVESVEKVISKFNKKILKMSRVKVKKDVVKLVL